MDMNAGTEMSLADCYFPFVLALRVKVLIAGGRDISSGLKKLYLCLHNGTVMDFYHFLILKTNSTFCLYRVLHGCKLAPSGQVTIERFECLAKTQCTNVV